MSQLHNLHPETDVLAPLPNADLAVESENSWPEFRLVEAEVRDNQGNLVNLFSASVKNLLEVSGTLKTNSLQEKHYGKASLVIATLLMYTN
jgi:hypothetical protein